MNAMTRREFVRKSSIGLGALWLLGIPGAKIEAASNNTSLYYTPLNTGSSLVLAGFSSRSEMIKAHAQSEPTCTTNPTWLPEQVCFHEHMNEEGDVLCLPPGFGYSDLTGVKNGWFSNWNDKISSVSWCRWDVSLFEHINYGGSELWLPAGCNTVYLEALGWNDKASSIVNWGFRRTG